MQQLAIDKIESTRTEYHYRWTWYRKTFTVAKLVTTLQRARAQRKQDLNLPPLSITLTAPTGESGAAYASQSLQKKFAGWRNHFGQCKTLHRLLGIGRDGYRYRQKSITRWFDYVDEASMLGLELCQSVGWCYQTHGSADFVGWCKPAGCGRCGVSSIRFVRWRVCSLYITELARSKRFDSNSVVGQFALAIQAKFACV